REDVFRRARTRRRYFSQSQRTAIRHYRTGTKRRALVRTQCENGMIHQAKSYLQYLVKSSNEHGVHSPFVFDLVTQCFYDLQRYPEYDILKNHRKALEADNSTIKMTDFGAG